MRIILAVLTSFLFLSCASKKVVSAGDPACLGKREIMWKRYNGPMKSASIPNDCTAKPVASVDETNRVPAQIEDTPKGCDETFRAEYSMEVPDRLQSELGKSNQLISLLKDTAAKAQAMAAKKASTCDDQFVIEDMVADLNLRMRDLQRKMQLGGTFNSMISSARSSVFSDAPLLAKVKCMADCQGPNMAPDVYVSCSKACKIADPFDRKFTGFYSIVGACRDGDGKLDLNHIRSNIAEYPYKYARAMESLIPHKNAFAKGITAAHQSYEKILPRLQAELARARKFKSDCKREVPAVKAKIMEQVVGVGFSGGMGSGFLVQVKHGRQLVTAHHVFTDPSRPESKSKTLEYLTATRRSNKNFALSRAEVVFQPGHIDRSNDAVATVVIDDGPAFSLVEEGKLPDPKLTYYIAGFPDSDPGFQVYPCRFRGVDVDPDNGATGPAYSLVCRGTQGPVQGMSGGPMLDENGQVWGVLSSQINLTGTIRIHPIFKDREEKLVLGIQNEFRSPNCATEYREGYECQYVPGAR